MPSGMLLFSKGMLPQSLEAQRQSLVAEVEAAPEDHVLEADDTAWAAGLVERHSVEPTFLHTENITMDDPKPCQVDVFWDQTRLIRVRPALVPGHRTTVHIPFTGEKDVFHLVPSTHIMRNLHAGISDSELRLKIEYPDDSPANIQAVTKRFTEGVETNLGHARQDIERFNGDLERDALTAIQGRRDRIERSRTHAAATGFPIRANRDPSKTYIADVITRRPAPVLPSTRAGKPLELEPVLLAKAYNDILNDIRQMGRSMERNPAAYASMGEEDRRHHLLDALNINYRGAGTAEAFNSNGRTDIRVLHEGRSLFIAECKIGSPLGLGVTHR